MQNHLVEVISGRLWCPLCYSNRRGRSNHSGHLGYRVPQPLTWSAEWMAMKRRSSGGPAGSKWQDQLSESFTWTWQAIAEFICRSTWEADSPRQTGTVMVMMDGGVWKLWAHDRDASESCFITGRTLEAAFKALDDVLRTGNGEWRPDRDRGGGGARRKT